MKLKILKRINDLSIEHPSWRIGQIIANAVREFDGRTDCDPFYIQDEALLEGLNKLYEQRIHN